MPLGVEEIERLLCWARDNGAAEATVEGVRVSFRPPAPVRVASPPRKPDPEFPEEDPDLFAHEGGS